MLQHPAINPVCSGKNSIRKPPVPNLKLSGSDVKAIPIPMKTDRSRTNSRVRFNAASSSSRRTAGGGAKSSRSSDFAQARGAIQAGAACVRADSTEWPGGEIRGQVNEEH